MIASSPGKIFIAEQDGICVVKLVGDIRVTLCSSIDTTIENMLTSDQEYKDVLINLMEAEAIDSTSLGLLAKLALHVHQRYGFMPTIVSTNPSITKLLTSIGFGQIFKLLTTLDENCANAEYSEHCKKQDWTEIQIKDKVIEAHKILMTLNDENKKAFRELVDNLEQGGYTN